jgi:transposase
MYAAAGRRSVPPEMLLKATVPMALYSIHSERAFCERLNYDLLFMAEGMGLVKHVSP